MLEAYYGLLTRGFLGGGLKRALVLGALLGLAGGRERAVAGLLDRTHDEVERVARACEVRSEAALVTYGGRQSLLFQGFDAGLLRA